MLNVFSKLKSTLFIFIIWRGLEVDKETEVGQEVTTESRRKFLKTAGKFAVYTPPALMLMSNASASYVKETNGNIKKDRKGKYGIQKWLNKRKLVKRKLVKRENRAKRRIAKRF